MATAAITWAIVGGVAVAGSTAMTLIQMNKAKRNKASQTYSDSMATQTSNTMPIPIIYGRVKTAGNQIYSDIYDNKQRVKRLIVFCDGKIKSISDLRFDDKQADSGDFSDVSYNFYLGDGVQEVDSRVPGDTHEERAKIVGSLRHDAYVALSAKANENLSGSFNVTAIVEGSIVKVYSSPTKYVEEYTNNPAWCVLDFLTRYNGVGLSVDEIDLESFIEASKFYKEKEYTLNLCLDEKQSRLEWVSAMLNCCRSSLVYKNGKYSLFVEKKSPVVQHFDSDSINDLSLWWLKLDEVPDKVYVQYIDPNNEWAKVNAVAEAVNPLRKQPRTEQYELYGVTNFNQASRLAWFYLNQAVTCNMFVKFKTDRRALNRTVGDVISLTDYITEFQNKEFRIMKLVDGQDGTIELTCREYNPTVYNEQCGATNPVFNVTTLANPSEPPPPVLYEGNEQEYYVLTDGTVISRIFLSYSYPKYPYSRSIRVWYQKKGTDEWQFGGIFQDDTYKAVINNMEVQQEYKFKFVHENDFGKFSTATYSPWITISGTNAPPNMPRDFDGMEVNGGINLWWSPTRERDVASYELYLGTVSEGTIITTTAATTYFYPAQAGKYRFLLVAIDTVGNKSTPALKEIEISAPGNVTGFDCVQNERNIEFKWNKVKGATYYVIKEGTSWEYGNFIGSSAGQTFTLPFAQATQVNFWIKAYSEYGTPSEIASYCTVQVASIPNRNMIYQYDAVEDNWAGIKKQSHINARGLQLDNNELNAEYIYKIELDQEYCSRNWVEKGLTPYSPSRDIRWGNAHFTWGSETGKISTWFPTTSDFTFTSQTNISIWEGIENQNLLKYWTLDSTARGSDGELPIAGSGVPNYADGRFHKGLLIDGNSQLKWENVEIPKKFSLSFNMRIPVDSDVTYSIVTLRNKSGDWMHLFYSSDDDTFVLQTSDGTELQCADYSKANDDMTFVVSQGDGKLGLIIYSAEFRGYKQAKIEYNSPKAYGSLALYSDFF